MGKRDRKGNDFGPSRPENKRIGRLDEQTLGYYRRVSDSMQEEFENEEDKGKNEASLLLSLTTTCVCFHAAVAWSYVCLSLPLS